MTNRKNTFLIKHSNTPGKVPTAGDLLLGELALNTADVILYASGTTANTILPIGWDRVARTGDTMTGALYVPYLNIKNFTGTTAVAGLAIDIDGNVITGSTFSSTFSGTTNYYSKFTSGGTISNGFIWDDGISSVNFMGTGTDNTAINIISQFGYYYPSLNFYNNGGNPTGSITGYGSELYINGGLKVHPNYINLPYHTPFTLLYTDATNYVKPVTIGSNLSFSTGGTLSVTGLTGGIDCDSLAECDVITTIQGDITNLQTAVTLKVTNITSSATPSIDYDVDQYNITALATNITSVSLSGTFVDRQRLIVTIKDNGTARTITWGSSFNGTWATLPTTTVVGKTWIGGFIYNATTSKYECVASFFSL